MKGYAAPNSRAAALRPLIRAYGPYAIALWMLACSRWGSYVIPGPPYIGDLAIAVILGERIYSAVHGQRASESVDAWLALTVGALLLWACLRLIYSSPLSITSLRDAAPYLYALLVFLVPAPDTSARARRRASQALFVALTFHALWFTLNEIDLSVVLRLPLVPGGSVHVFEARPDFDGAVCGVAVAISLRGLIQGRLPGVNLAFLAWNMALLLSTGSRAGLLALGAQVIFMLLLAPTRRDLVRRLAPRILAIGLIIIVPAAVVAASDSLTVRRFVDGLAVYLPIIAPSHTNNTGGAGTAQARSKSWRVLEQWLVRRDRRNYLGVGFGPDFLHKSGADLLLLNGTDPDVRSPHNFFLNTWARLGLLGLSIVITVLLAGVRLAQAVSRSADSLEDVDLAAVLVVVGIPVAAAVGVILESPFGAISWFWALGYLSQRARQLRVATPWDGGRPAMNDPGPVT